MTVLSSGTFVSRMFRLVLISVLPVVLIHLSHCGELRFTLIQPVVWALLKRQSEQVEYRTPDTCGTFLS